jgi:hypothetical protein
VLNLRAAYALSALDRAARSSSRWRIGDRRYAYRPGYPMPGLTGQIGLNYSL